MFLVYLLWIVVVGGGLFIGGGAVLTMTRQGLDAALLLNAVVYLGFAVYGLPKLTRLMFGRK